MEHYEGPHDTGEEDPTGLSDLWATADMIVDQVRQRVPYEEGYTISCADPTDSSSDRGDQAPSRQIWFKQSGGYVELGIVGPELHAGSFPRAGAPGSPQHMEVVNRVGRPARGNPTDWLAEQLAKLGEMIEHYPERCRVSPA